MRIGAGAAGAQGRRKWFPSSPEGLFCHVEEFARVSSAKGERHRRPRGQVESVEREAARAPTASLTNDYQKPWETGLYTHPSGLAFTSRAVSVVPFSQRSRGALAGFL